MRQVEEVAEAARVLTSSEAEEGQAYHCKESEAGKARSEHSAAAEVGTWDVGYV